MYSVIYQELKSQKDSSSVKGNMEDLHRKLTNPSKILSKAVAVIVLDYCRENKLDNSQYLLDNGKSVSIVISTLPPGLKNLLLSLSHHIR